MSARTYAGLGLTITLLACALLYWPAMHGPFLFDDFPNLAPLDSIDHVSSWSSWRDLGIYLSQPRNFPGRPLAMLSFLLQKASWPDHPLPFRPVNASIHLLSGVLVFGLYRRIARHWLYSQGQERPMSPLNGASPFKTRSSESVCSLQRPCATLCDRPTDLVASSGHKQLNLTTKTNQQSDNTVSQN